MSVGRGELPETEIMTTADVIISVLDPLYRRLLQTNTQTHHTLLHHTSSLVCVKYYCVTSCSKSHMEEKQTSLMIKYNYKGSAGSRTQEQKNTSKINREETLEFLHV